MVIWIIFNLCTHGNSPDESIVEFPKHEDWSFEEIIFSIFFISDIDTK